METVADYLAIDIDQRDIQSLLSFACKRDISWLFAHPEYRLKVSEKKILDKSIQELQKGVPLAYIRGYQDFHNYRFLVTPAVLIPRPESEMIIESGIEYLKEHGPVTFLDLGTGSGALILSLAAETKKLKYHLGCRFLASDISEVALQVAKKNAKKLDIDLISFKHGDLLLPWKDILSANDKPIFIAANLPYLTPVLHKYEPSIAHEPKLALVGGRDGLSLYRRLLKQLKPVVSRCPFRLIMEINPDRAATLSSLAKTAFPSATIKKVPDLSGRTRFISIEN